MFHLLVSGLEDSGENGVGILHSGTEKGGAGSIGNGGIPAAYVYGLQSLLRRS